MLKKVNVGFLLAFFLFTGNAFAESEWDQQNVPIDKEWTIEFSTELMQKTVNTNNIYITDEAGDKLSSIEVSMDNNEVTVTNQNQYEDGKTYNLHITNSVKSINGLSLGNEVVMEFVTGGEESEVPSSSSSSDSEEDQILSDILSEYEQKFEGLQEQSEADLNDLVQQANEELQEEVEDNGKTESEIARELAPKYLPKAQNLEEETDESFNSIYESLVNQLQKNGYSSAKAKPFKEDYQEEKEAMREDLIKTFLE